MSHARKHVIRSVRDELVEPDPKRNQSIVRVAETRGQNLYLAEKPSGEKLLCILPAKFRKAIWIKRGDYLIIESEPDTEPNKAPTSKVRSVIQHVLYPMQIKHLKEKSLWPAEFVTPDEEDKKKKDGIAPQPRQSKEDDSEDEDDDLPANPNRRQLDLEDDEKEENEEEDEDDED